MEEGIKKDYQKIWIFCNCRFVTEKYYKEQIKKAKEEGRKEMQDKYNHLSKQYKGLDKKYKLLKNSIIKGE